jgi:hypothetical protein
MLHRQTDRFSVVRKCINDLRRVGIRVTGFSVSVETMAEIENEAMGISEIIIGSNDTADQLFSGKRTLGGIPLVVEPKNVVPAN